MSAYTKKQTEILQFIAQFRLQRSMAPTLKEIATEMNTSRPTVLEHLRKLENKDAIKRLKFEERSIEIIDQEFMKEWHHSRGGNPIDELKILRNVFRHEFEGEDWAPCKKCHLDKRNPIHEDPPTETDWAL